MLENEKKLYKLEYKKEHMTGQHRICSAFMIFYNLFGNRNYRVDQTHCAKNYSVKTKMNSFVSVEKKSNLPARPTFKYKPPAPNL